MASSSNSTGSFSGRRERAAIDMVDRIWTGTHSMAERLEGSHAHVRFIPCGVEAKRFAEPKGDQAAKAREEIRELFSAASPNDSGRPVPLAGYFGVLNDRFDLGLVKAMAGEGWRVLLIGPGSSQMEKMPSDSRIRWIGPF